jgi:hypothetical protein
MPASWISAFRGGMQVYLESLNEERRFLRVLKEKGHPGVTAFLTWRRPNVGGSVLCNLVEYEMDFVLPEEWARHELVVKIEHLLCDIMMYQNDVLSAISGKDDAMLNIAFALSRDLELDQQESVGLVREMHDAAVRRVSKLYSDLEQICEGDARMMMMARHQQNAFAGLARFQQEASRWSLALPDVERTVPRFAEETPREPKSGIVMRAPPTEPEGAAAVPMRRGGLKRVASSGR